MANDGTVRIGTEIDDSGFKSGLTKLGSVAKAGLSATGTAIKAVAGSATAAVGSLLALESATEQYRAEQGRLNSAFEASGYSTELAKQAYKDFFGILGESDTAVEASQLLAQLSLNAEDMSTWTRISAGVWGTFGKSLPIESLIEATNETAKVGKVTGVLADALNWVGISEDEFNNKLAAAGSEAARNQLIMETLSNTYDKAADAFYQNNDALVEARNNQVLLDDTLASLGDTVARVKNGLMSEFLPSIAALVSAFNGLITGADGANAAFSDAMQGFISEVVQKLPEFLTFGAQILASIVNGLLQSAPDLTAAAIELLQNLLSAINGNASAVSEGGAEIIRILAAGFAEAYPLWLEAIYTLLGLVVNAVISAAPDVLQSGLDLLQALADGFVAGIPIFSEKIPQLITQFVGWLTENLPSILEQGTAIIDQLVQGIISALPVLASNIPAIITSIADFVFAALPQILQAGIELVLSLLAGILQAVPDILAEIPNIIRSIVDIFANNDWAETGANLLNAIKDGILNTVPELVSQLPTVITALVSFFISSIPLILESGVKLIGGLISGIIQAIPDILAAAGDVISQAASAFTSYDWLGVGSNILTGIGNGIKNAVKGVVDAAKSAAQSIYDSVTGFFDIHSPSRLMIWVGSMIMMGLGGGMQSKIKYIESVATSVSDVIKSEIQKTQDEIAEIERKAQEERAAEELAEHKKQLAEKYNELKKAETKERAKIQEEIAELEREWADKQAEAAREAEKEKLNAKLEGLESYQEEYEKRLQEIQDLETDMFTKLADYGDLFTRTKEKDKELFELGDLRKQIDEIDAYSQKINELKTRGVSVGLMDEILGMSVEDATEYMDALLSKTPEQLDEYIALFEEKQEKAKEVAKNFWQTDYAELEAEFAEKIPENISGLKDEMYTLGTDSGTAISDGIKAQSKVVEDSLLGIVGGAIVSATGMLNSFISSLSSQMGSIQGRMTAAVVSATPTSVPVTVNNAASAAEYTTTRAVKAIGGLMDYYMGEKPYDTSTSKREIVLTLNGTEVARALVDDIRKVEDQSPRIVSD